MIRTLSVVSVAALALAAGETQAAVMQLDINQISVNAGGSFDGVTHTGTLNITDPTAGIIIDVLVDGQSFGPDQLMNFSGSIDLVNGQVVGGSISVTAMAGAMYTADIGQGGEVNTQAGRGFRIDGLTFTGAFSNLTGGTNFGGVDVVALFGQDAEVDGSFLLHSYDPNANGVDRADIDIYIVPTPGTLTLAGLAGIAVLRRKR